LAKRRGGVYAYEAGEASAEILTSRIGQEGPDNNVLWCRDVMTDRKLKKMAHELVQEGKESKSEFYLRINEMAQKAHLASTFECC